MPDSAHRSLLLLALLATVAAAHAQQPSPAEAQPSAVERAQRDADKVFLMILQQSDKPRRVVREERAAAPALAPASAAALPARAASRAQPPARNAPPAEPTATASAAPSAVTPSVPAPVAEVPPTQPSEARTTSMAAALPAAVAPATTAAAPAEVSKPRNAKLELVASVEPEFPSRLVQSLGAGSVLVNFEVQPDGTVSRTEVVRTSHRGLNAAAQAAVAAWRFKPIDQPRPGVVELKFE